MTFQRLSLRPEIDSGGRLNQGAAWRLRSKRQRLPESALSRIRTAAVAALAAARASSHCWAYSKSESATARISPAMNASKSDPRIRTRSDRRQFATVQALSGLPGYSELLPLEACWLGELALAGSDNPSASTQTINNTWEARRPALAPTSPTPGTDR
jgi:hypothetical protein